MSGNYQEFLNYFKGKSIAVVGSGSSVLSGEYGLEIENHDIVVRINRGYPYERYRKYVGSRTDIWSFGMGNREDLRIKFNKMFSDRRYSMYPWFVSSWVPKYLREDPRHITLPPGFSKAAMSKCGGTPATTGMDTIHFIVVGTECKSLSLYGLDFYKTEYWFKEEDDSIPITYTTKEKRLAHTPKAEELFLEELIADHKKIKWIK